MGSSQAEERKTLAFSLQKALFGLRAEEQLLRGAEAGLPRQPHSAVKDVWSA